MVTKSTSKKVRPGKDLILLFTAPIVVILLAVALVYAPRLFANPTYDFIYSSCASYDCNMYGVETDGKMKMNYSSFRSEYNKPTLYYFNTATNTATRIDESRAYSYSLLQSQKSPDDYRLVSENGNGGFLFWNSDSEGSSWYLADGLKKKSVNLVYEGDDYKPVTFIGWVQK